MLIQNEKQQEYSNLFTITIVWVNKNESLEISDTYFKKEKDNRLPRLSCL